MQGAHHNNEDTYVIKQNVLKGEGTLKHCYFADLALGFLVSSDSEAVLDFSVALPFQLFVSW
jgi:hypothetical protein